MILSNCFLVLLINTTHTDRSHFSIAFDCSFLFSPSELRAWTIRSGYHCHPRAHLCLVEGRSKMITNSFCRNKNTLEDTFSSLLRLEETLLKSFDRRGWTKHYGVCTWHITVACNRAAFFFFTWIEYVIGNFFFLHCWILCSKYDCKNGGTVAFTERLTNVLFRPWRLPFVMKPRDQSAK